MLTTDGNRPIVCKYYCILNVQLAPWHSTLYFINLQKTFKHGLRYGSNQKYYYSDIHEGNSDNFKQILQKALVGWRNVW